MIEHADGPAASEIKIGSDRLNDQSTGKVSADSKADFDIRIAADGTWFHEGKPIKRKRLVKLFASVLKRDEVGDYWLETPVEKGRIVVEDAPFIAVEVEKALRDGRQVLSFRTNLDDWVEAGEDHPIHVTVNTETGEPRPYVSIRNGLEALILRPVFYCLAEEAEVEDGRSGVRSNGVFFPLDGPE
jgi:hypothetical protein